MQLAVTGTPEGIPSWYADVFDIHKITEGAGGWTRRTIRANRWHPDVADYRDRLVETYSFSQPLLDTYMRGQFVPLRQGRAYSAFDPATHVVSSLPEQPAGLDLYVGADFNIDSMRWVVGYLLPDEVQIIGEIALGANGSTSLAARELVERYGNRHRRVVVCGDAAGRARSTAGRIDYTVVREELRGHFRDVTIDVAASNPRQKDRVDAVNYHLSGRGRNVAIHVSCRELIRDLQQVVWKQGARVELDKSNPSLTHASDGFGYLIWQKARPSVFSGPRQARPAPLKVVANVETPRW